MEARIRRGVGRAGGRRGLAAAVSAALCLSGCGETPPKLVPVTGRVMLKGEIPVTAGSIFFHPDAGNTFREDRPSSQILVDGSFEMKTFPFGTGVPPGKYKVTLGSEIASRIKHPELADASKTPWVMDVTEAGETDQVFSAE